MITRSRDAALSVDGSDMGAFFESFFVRPAVFVHRKALLTIQFVSREMVTAFQTLFGSLALHTHDLPRLCSPSTATPGVLGPGGHAASCHKTAPSNSFTGAPHYQRSTPQL
jgi:hypothetical protein